MKRITISLNWFAVTTSTSLTGLVQTAYSRAVEFAFQPQLYFAQFAQMKTWDANSGDPMPGSAVTFTIFDNLSASTGALSETTDPTAATMAKTQASITLKEYGNLVTRTQKIKTLSFADIDFAAARVVGNNMGTSVDLIARAAYDAETGASYIGYGTGATTLLTITTTSVLKARNVRYAYNRLARNNVIKPDGRFYVAVIHPDVAYDLKKETGAGAWRTPHEYVDPSEIYNGEIGEFEGFRFVETSNARVQTDAGTNSVDVYSSYFFGWQAVGYAEGIAPDIGFSGPFDALQRLMNVYWYGLMGFGAVRASSMFKFFTSSSIGSN